MNPNLKITACEEKVGADNEYIFGDDLHDKLDGVCTVLDNVETRLYVDWKCLFNRLPMLESGTLGTRGNTPVMSPHRMETYGATRDPPENSRQIAEDTNAYLSDLDFVDSQEQNTKLDTVRTIHRTLREE